MSQANPPSPATEPRTSTVVPSGLPARSSDIHSPPVLFDLQAGPGGVVGPLENWRMRQIADVINHLPGRGEPSGYDDDASVVEPYQVQGLVLRNDREVAWTAAYIRSLVTYRNPASVRRWTARQAGYDHARAVDLTTGDRASGGLPQQLVPTRHGHVARTWLGGTLTEVALLRPRRAGATYQGTVHGVVGGWVAYSADGRRTSTVRHDYEDAEATLLVLRTGHRSQTRYPWHLLAPAQPLPAAGAATVHAAPRTPPPLPQPGRVGPRR